jgi:1,4-dihydroxy-2-naphthoate octaprenyltransferase
MSISMWKHALTSIPRLSPEEFKKLDFFSKWLIVTRAAVLIITFLSAAIAGILAHRDGRFDGWIWFLVTLGLLLAHATNNMLNDFVDWSKGVDQQNYYRNRYGTHPMILMDKQEFFTYLFATGLSALGIGLYLCYLKGMGVVYLTVFGAFFLLFYTWPLKYYGLGEVSVFLVWGILMIGGG